jgi:hypothetical protein
MVKKSPGPVHKTPLTAIGFLMNVHPGFVSSRVLHSQLLNDFDREYAKYPDLLAVHNLRTTRTPVKMYLSRRKINTDYSLNDVTQPISSDAFMLYVPLVQTELALIYLTKFSTLSAPSSINDPMCIPLKAKYHSPGKFGQYVARHNSFLHDHRNFAIVGMVPEARKVKIYGILSPLSLESITGIPVAGLRTWENGTFPVRKISTLASSNGLIRTLLNSGPTSPASRLSPFLLPFQFPRGCRKAARSHRAVPSPRA